VNSFELALAKLKSLPPASQVQVVDYIHQLHEATRSERLEALWKTAGCLTPEEADALEKAIEDRCERVDE
jgi:hypothetical protein